MKKILTLMCASALMLGACSDSDQKDPNLKLGVKGVKSTLKATVVADLNVTDFKMIIGEVEFELDKDPLNPSFVPQELEYKGPFEVSILKDGVVQNFDLPATVLPVGPVHEVEFDIEKNPTLAKGHEMFGKSVLIKGKYKTVPFVIWDDKDQELEIEYETPEGAVTLTNSLVLMDIQVKITNIVTELAAIDFETFRDGNKNGVIEIGPGNTDGNVAITKIIEKVEKHCSLLKR